jgi:hypothetical protein
MTRCHYCGERATTSIIVRLGVVPKDPKKVNTQQDLSAFEVRPLCDKHRPRVAVDA